MEERPTKSRKTPLMFASHSIASFSLSSGVDVSSLLCGDNVQFSGKKIVLVDYLA